MKVTLYNKETKTFETFSGVESVGINKDFTLIEITYPVSSVLWDGHTDRFDTNIYQLSSVTE